MSADPAPIAGPPLAVRDEIEQSMRSPPKYLLSRARVPLGSAHWFAVLLILTAATACSDRALGETVTDETGELLDESHRPVAGVLYADCSVANDCELGLHCFFPEGESGYCTDDCGSDETCQQVPGTEIHGSCVGVVGSMDYVCAISCQGNSCPFGMRCESVEVDGGVERICF